MSLKSGRTKINAEKGIYFQNITLYMYARAMSRDSNENMYWCVSTIHANLCKIVKISSKYVNAQNEIFFKSVVKTQTFIIHVAITTYYV